MESNMQEILEVMDQTTSLLGGRMLTILKAAPMGQKAVNEVVKMIEAQVQEKIQNIPQDQISHIPKYHYHVVHGNNGQTKLQITIPVEPTLEAIDKALTAFKSSFAANVVPPGTELSDLETAQETTTEEENTNDNSDTSTG